MKRVIITAVAVVLVGSLMLLAVSEWQNAFTLISLAVLVGVLALSFLYFEVSVIGTKQIALIATLSAFTAVSRIVFAPIPNVQPVTFLTALCGLVLGPFPGFLVGCTSAFVSNIFLGQGPWTPWQMFAWGLIGLFCGLWGKNGKKPSPVAFGLACVGFSFLFGWIMNLWQAVTYLRPFTWFGFLLTYVTSLLFDLMHAAGSFLLAILFYEKFYKILHRYKRRMDVTYIEPPLPKEAS